MLLGGSSPFTARVVSELVASFPEGCAAKLGIPGERALGAASWKNLFKYRSMLDAILERKETVWDVFTPIPGLGQAARGRGRAGARAGQDIKFLLTSSCARVAYPSFGIECKWSILPRKDACGMAIENWCRVCDIDVRCSRIYAALGASLLSERAATMMGGLGALQV